jgi:hypothetical protein
MGISSLDCTVELQVNSASHDFFFLLVFKDVIAEHPLA